MRALLWIAAASLGCAQNLPTILKQGEDVFAKTCSNGYCHGAKGAGAGAPRLSGRGFTQAYITTTVTRGVPGTSMPSFAANLSRADLGAVAAYVATLNGVANPTIAAVPANAPAPLSGDAARGRALFTDAVRGFGRCSTCHEVAGLGIPVATPIAKVPASAAALKSLATPAVSTATVAGESMPILLVGRKTQQVLFYDLTAAPPVLGTVEPADIKTTDGSAWKHASAIASYSDSELTSILTYLKAVAR